MQRRIPTPNYSFFKTKVYLVPTDVALLLSIDVLDNEKLEANNVQAELQEAHHG